MTANVKLDNAGVTAVSHVQVERTQLLLFGDGWLGGRLGSYRPVRVLPTRRRRLARGRSAREELVFQVPPNVLRRATRAVLVVEGGFHAPHGNGQWQRHPFDYRKSFDRFTPPFVPPVVQT